MPFRSSYQYHARTVCGDGGSNSAQTALGLAPDCELKLECRADESAAYNSLLEAKVAALEGALKQKSLDVAEASGSSGSSHHSPTPAVRQRPSTSRSPLTVVDMPPQDQDIDHDITLDDAGLLSPPQGRPQEMIEAHEPVQAHSFPKIVPSFQPPSHLLNAANLTPSEPAEQSFGTLVLTDSGRSKWLGPTAASDWLKDVSWP